MLHPSLGPFLPALRDVCRQLRVQRLYFFGSALTERFEPGRSDLDVLVQLLPAPDPLDRGERLLSLWDALEALFGRRVDLVTPEQLRNPYFILELDQTKRLVYDVASETETAV